MVRKVLLTAFLFLVISGYAFANGRVELDGSAWLNTTVENVTSVVKTTFISTTNIYPNKDRILGWSIIPCNTVNPVMFAALYDANSITGLNEVISENEYERGVGGAMWLPYPYPLSSQLMLDQSGNSKVIIYHTR